MVVFLNHEDVPSFKKGGSMVRNSYFWALRSVQVKLLAIVTGNTVRGLAGSRCFCPLSLAILV